MAGHPAPYGHLEYFEVPLSLAHRLDRSPKSIDMSNSSPADVHVAFCTCPDSGTAESLAAALIEEGHAACINLIPGLVSLYRWQGRIERDSEVLLMIKTVRERLGTLTERVRQLHPYDVPEVIAHPVTDGHDAYLNWVRQCIDTAE